MTASTAFWNNAARRSAVVFYSEIAFILQRPCGIFVGNSRSMRRRVVQKSPIIAIQGCNLRAALFLAFDADRTAVSAHD
jgi:hypothetical protein